MSNKKKSAKKQLKNFIKGNRVMLAALGGAATGIALAAVLGTDKAKEVLGSVEGAVKGLTSKFTHTDSKRNATLVEA